MTENETQVWSATYAAAFSVYVQESNHTALDGEMHVEASVFAKEAADIAVKAYNHSCDGQSPVAEEF